MRKFITLFALCGLISGQAFGDKVHGVGGKTYGCRRNDVTANVNNGSHIQFIGKTTFRNTDYTYLKVYCTKAGGSRAHFEIQDTQWCPNAKFQKKNIPNAKYCLYSNNKETYCLKTKELANNTWGSTGGCLSSRCDEESIQVRTKQSA